MGEKRRNGFCLSWSFSVVSGNAVGLFPGERAGLVGRLLGDFVFKIVGFLGFFFSVK
jgi:hypothetical protein